MVLSLCGLPWSCPQRRALRNAKLWAVNGARRKVDLIIDVMFLIACNMMNGVDLKHPVVLLIASFCNVFFKIISYLLNC